MKYKKLDGISTSKDIDTVKTVLDNNNDIVFLYTGADHLYDYIEKLYEKGRGLDSNYLYKFRICYERKDLDITFSNSKTGKHLSTMSSILDELDGKNRCNIVVENNDRIQLAFIMQQLIYIEYPVELVDIFIREEKRDANKTKRFMKEIDALSTACNDAISRLKALKFKTEAESDDDNPSKAVRLKEIEDSIESCITIQDQIAKAKKVELKFAIAASKKAGKSVIVNCFLGEQIAPTSTELATPNNCIYEKSGDSLYHLRLDGKDTVEDYDRCIDIYDRINNEFRKAQNDRDGGFSIPDMYIDYVTDNNNFSSYTIYDTAGPDAAGTDHYNVAINAMKKCDVAVFAIDYSKYLTTSEESYLKEIKEIFTKENKFHSLIFALNKIDVRYTDTDSPKSFIMSVDFIKTRLANINDAYGDCIIFPTCSLEYFNTIEAEKARISELNVENAPTISELGRIKLSHRDVPALHWLHTHAENLSYYHGIESFSYDVFKKDSGMPALMRYVSYVAQSKARFEIVNNITFNIAQQKTKIQSIIDYISNIESLINADDEKISEITAIIDDYADSVKNVLSDEIRVEELAHLDDTSQHAKKSTGLLSLPQIKGNFGKFMEYQKNKLLDMCDRKRIAEDMYSDSVNLLWDRISDETEFDGHKIDSMFSTSDFNRIANTVSRKRIEDAANEVYRSLSLLSREVKIIVDYRQSLLSEESKKCRERLEKENVLIELPKMPEFEFAARMTPPDEIVITVDKFNLHLYDRLSSLFEKKILSNVGVFVKGLFGRIFGRSVDEKEYKLRFNASQSQFFSECDRSLKDSFKAFVYESNIDESLRNALKDTVVNNYMTALLTELRQVFISMNTTFNFCIEQFRSAIDDRDKYKFDIELLNLRKSNIESISEHTSALLNVWNSIIEDDTEENNVLD